MVRIRELLGKKENILIRELVRIRELVGIMGKMLIKELVGKALLKSSCDFQVQQVIWGTKYSSDSSTKYFGPFKDHLPLILYIGTKWGEMKVQNPVKMDYIV